MTQLSQSSDVNVASMLLDKLKKRQKLFELMPIRRIQQEKQKHFDEFLFGH